MTTINKTIFVPLLNDSEQQKLQQRLLLGNTILILTALWAAVAISIAFIFEANFSLGAQIAAHISIIVCSLTLKVGYLLRSFALKKLGSQNF